MTELEALQAQLNRLNRQIEQLENQIRQVDRRSTNLGRAINAVHAATAAQGETLGAQIEENKKTLSALKSLYQESKIAQEKEIQSLKSRMDKLEQEE